MGGGTAIELALSEPHRVRALVLLSPGIPGYQWPDEPGLDAEYAALIASNEQAAQRIPGCRLITMPGVDHYPTVRDPRLVVQTIRDHCLANV